MNPVVVIESRSENVMDVVQKVYKDESIVKGSRSINTDTFELIN